MKDQLFFFALFLLTLTSQAQENNSLRKDIITLNVERDFLIEKQLDLYTILPTTLSLWDNGDWSSISFSGNSTEGDFKTTDALQKSQGFSFKTESVQSYKEKGLKLYGNFTYGTASHEEANWNLFFQKSDIGSPFRIITNKIGDWRTKHYGLSGILTKQLSKKIYVGLSAKYKSDIYYRTIDTRNEQFNLIIDFKTSISYNLSKNRYLSIGVGYQRKKSKPELRDHFKRDESLYKIKITKGFGAFDDFLSDDFDKMVITDQNPNLSLAYHTSDDNKKNNLSISYSLYPGSELWKLNSDFSETESEEQYKYDYLKHNATISKLINKVNYSLLSKLNLEFISGKAYIVKKGMQDASIYDGFKLNGTIDLLRNNKKIFDQTSLAIGFENVSKKDMVYGHLMEYTNLNFDFQTGFHFDINKLNKVKINGLGGYKTNIFYTHNPSSAKALAYTEDIAYNEMAFYTADYYKLGGNVSWFHQFTKSATEIALKFEKLTPTNININNPYSLLNESTNRTYIGLNINLIF